MRQRLTAGDVAPPDGYVVRPFMADSYRYVAGLISDHGDPTKFRSTVAVSEEEHG
jgi:hypothetical protein